MSESSGPNVKADDIEEQIKTIREDISRLTKLFVQLGQDSVSNVKETAREEADELLNRSRRVADDASARAKQTADSLEGYIGEKPVQSVIMALLAGIFIGFLSRR